MGGWITPYFSCRHPVASTLQFVGTERLTLQSPGSGLAFKPSAQRCSGSGTGLKLEAALVPAAPFDGASRTIAPALTHASGQSTRTSPLGAPPWPNRLFAMCPMTGTARRATTNAPKTRGAKSRRNPRGPKGTESSTAL
jgi:hypothetical protein